ncbi:hypothetical protein RJ639_022021 [Escallonia herrerae]|uniref:Protein kinase domain-containing protein n=1 Tax=Escallonia herrerae TaxID=1293975 RepID=A0AA88V4W8_9ASTE|nr:hypothetical protein RJ639_022021 [Escallonia herrerae]
MIGSPSINEGFFSMLRTRSRAVKKKTIIAGLKSDNFSREMLLRLLTLAVMPGDCVLAVHVQEPDDAFDPNTFHIHEDLCKSKQVDFQVKVCAGDSYITELGNQVRISFAAILALGCSTPWPKDSTVSRCLKALPPTCTLLVMDNGGKIVVQMPGISQQGSVRKVLQFSSSALSDYATPDQLGSRPNLRKSLSTPSSSPRQTEIVKLQLIKKPLQLPDHVVRKLFQRLATLEAKGSIRRFTTEELKLATNTFSPDLLIGEGGHSIVYRGKLENGQAVAVKVFRDKEASEDDLLHEVEVLSGLKHENIVQLSGYCCSNALHAVVYNLLKESLMQKVEQLRWSERMTIAIGVAKALDYLHSLSPPIIHRDVKSSNILISDECIPQVRFVSLFHLMLSFMNQFSVKSHTLSDFGTAMEHQENQQASVHTKPYRVVGTFGYLAPEYMMYGKVDEKIDVYSYGVVLLELITGKKAIFTNQEANPESLLLWARSLLSCGLCERLIDPSLGRDYNEDEVKTMITAARLCLLHSSSRRPTMKTILRVFKEPDQWLQRQREELLNGISSGAEIRLYKQNGSDTNGAPVCHHDKDNQLQDEQQPLSDDIDPRTEENSDKLFREMDTVMKLSYAVSWDVMNSPGVGTD